MTLVPNEAEQALNRQYDIYAAAREEYRKKIAEQADEIERLRAVLTKADKLYRICDGKIPEPENIKAVWDDTKASVRAALETREAGVSSEGE